MSCLQECQKVNSTFVTGAFKPGEQLIANMGAVSVLTFVSCTCIIHVHVTGDFKSGTQNLVFLQVEDIVVFSDDVVYFPCWYIDAELKQLLPDQGLSDMGMVVLV